MASKTAAQEEFDNILAKASAPTDFAHRDDADDYKYDKENDELDEEEEFQKLRIDETMKMPLFERSNGGLSAGLKLPHKDFDNGRTTGVKGVIADARSFEEARRNTGWRNRFSRGNSLSKVDKRTSFINKDGGSDVDSASDDEEFLERWRQQRREEMQNEGKDIRNRRTSPSVRRYGRFDEVDAMGYLDAIEKVGRETVVVVFVYDDAVSTFLLPILLLPHANNHPSAPSPKSSPTPSSPSSPPTPPSISFASTTKTSNSTTPASPPSSPTRTKETSSQT
jgi:hypothetical protein